MNYDTDGGSYVSPTIIDNTTTSAALNVTNVIPTKAGYEFKGWKDENGNMVSGSVTLNWSEGYGSKNNPVSKTLYAVWEETKTYTVIYKDGADSKVFGDESHGNLKVGEDTPSFLGRTTRDGYTFMGWAPAINPKVAAEDANR